MRIVGLRGAHSGFEHLGEGYQRLAVLSGALSLCDGEVLTGIRVREGRDSGPGGFGASTY